MNASPVLLRFNMPGPFCTAYIIKCIAMQKRPGLGCRGYWPLSPSISVLNTSLCRIWSKTVQNGTPFPFKYPDKTGLAFIFWTGLDQVRWKLVFRTDSEKPSLDYRRQIKPGQFYTAIHLTIWAVQNGPGMLNRNEMGLSLIFWTGLDQIRWKLMFRTDFEKHSLDYRRKLKPGQFCTTLLCRMVRPCRMVRAS